MKHVTFRRGFGDCFRGESASGAGAILDKELLAEVLGQPLSDQAAEAGYDSSGVGHVFAAAAVTVAPK